jgi:hypothetical protein
MTAIKLDPFRAFEKQGINMISQPVKITEGFNDRSRIIIFFCEFKRASGTVHIDTYGISSLPEEELPMYMDAYKNDPPYARMYSQADQTFKNMRARDLNAHDMTEELANQCQKFYDTYIADKKLIQEFNPASHQLGLTPYDDGTFSGRRQQQIVNQRIGTMVEKDHWGLKELLGLNR